MTYTDEYGIYASLGAEFDREAGIEDARLHDLRQTAASQATMNGVPLQSSPACSSV